MKNLYYLNISELRKICDKFGISYNIYIEDALDTIKKTSEYDDKNINYYINKKKIPKKTIYTQKIINNNLKLTKDSYIYYNEYKTTNKNILLIIKKLTNNKFKFGAVSQRIIRDIWKKNKLITYDEFAKLWLSEFDNYKTYDTFAYNNFMKMNRDKNKWHTFRKKNCRFDFYRIKYNYLIYKTKRFL